MSSDEDVGACWFAIHTHPRQEMRAAHNLQAWGVEAYNPTLKKRRLNEYGGQSFVSSPLFPRYIFARFDLQSQLHKIRFTRGVQGVVGYGGVPVPLADEVIDFIRSQVGQDGFIHTEDALKSGDSVVIKNGPLKSLVGIFQKEVKTSNRVIILLSFIKYQGRILVNREMVEKIA